MTEEDKNLLIQDLCARLPYGVKIKTSYDKIDEPMELIFINNRNESFAIGGSFTLISGLDFDTYECKPYLFPLSSMTEEQKTSHNFLKHSAHANPIKLIDWYNKNHMDFRGLIPKGLAIDCTNLNIYWYALLIILTYFIIGFVVGLFIYDYHCKDFNKKNKNKEFKVTWEEYSYREGPGFCMAFAIVLWPILLLIAICYYMFYYPIKYIKEHNGIK